MHGRSFPAPATPKDPDTSSIEVAQRIQQTESRLAAYQGLPADAIPLPYGQHSADRQSQRL